MNWKALAVIVLSLLQLFSVRAQSVSSRRLKANYPEIGKPCPGFSLRNINYYTKTEVSLKDFRGKWVVLDFFSTGCTACFKSFPKMNQLRKDFAGRIEFFIIGYDDKYIRKSYEKSREVNELDMPVTYEPSNGLPSRFGIVGLPHIIVIDDKGIVRAITTSVTKDILQEFLSGNDPGLIKKASPEEIELRNKLYNPDKPLLIGGNGGSDTDFLFRSILTKWNGDIIGRSFLFMNAGVGNRVTGIGQPIERLYYYAYGDTLRPYPSDPSDPHGVGQGSCYGEFWSKPLLEVTDMEPFQWSNQTRKNLYNYSLTVPLEKANVPFLQKIMRRDLSNYFNYNVVVEERTMPYWKLVVSSESKFAITLKQNLNNDLNMAPYTGFRFRNTNMAFLTFQLGVIFQTEPPFIDETGVKETFSIEINAQMQDLNDVKRAFEVNGLSLVKGEKKMKVIVIRDPKN